MESHLFPIQVALVTFPVVAFLLTIPFLLYQYKKYKYVNKLRVLVIYSFLLYCIISYYLIILPLPSSRDISSIYPRGRDMYQLIPFNFIRNIINETDVILDSPFTYIYFFREEAFLQAIYNILLLTPLGIYLRYYFRKSYRKTILIGFLVSLFFELTQITGLYGIYNAPYRLFDVDDLILNTTGCFIGYIAAPLFTFFLPESNILDKNANLDKMYVGFIRRALAVSIDWIIIRIAINTFVNINEIIEYILSVLIYFIIMEYFTNGRTIGKMLTSIRIRGSNDRLTFKELFIRYGILYYVIGLVNKILISIKGQYFVLQLIIFGLVFTIDTVIVIIVLASIIKRESFFYEKISKTKNVIDYKKSK